MKLVDTRIIEKFLSDDEIDTIIKEVETGDPDYPPFSFAFPDNFVPGPWPPVGNIDRRIQPIIFPNFKKTQDILESKLKAQLGDDINLTYPHILNAHYPYMIHADVSPEQIPEGHYGAWTIVIPIDNYDSHTISFNEYAFDIVKGSTEYIQKYGVKKNEIDEETYQKYFTHMDKETLVDYFSIEQIFPWKKGDLFVSSRYRYHTSDNFLKNNVEYKRAIILWITLPL